MPPCTCPTVPTPSDNSQDLCAELLGQPLPNPLPKTIEEFGTFLKSGKVPVFGYMYRDLTSTYPKLAEKLMDMGTDHSILVAHFPWITIIITLPRWVTRALFVFGGYGTTILSCRELGGDGCHLLLWSIHHQDMELAGRLCPRRNDSNRLGCKQEQEAIRRIGDGNCGTWHCLV